MSRSKLTTEATEKKLADIRDCCGCAACFAICPCKAISLHRDGEGFLRPVVDSTRCCRCGKCKASCPVLNSGPSPVAPMIVYAARSLDAGYRDISSSGGVFPLLAEEILSRGGSVYGAAMAFPSLQVKHVRVETKKELQPVLGSKYVQSDMSAVFSNLATDVRSGKQVLFSGTPCQVAAVRSFLKQQPENLWLVDVACHGVSSPSVFDNYCKSMIPEGKRDDVCGCVFRDKRFGWEKTGPTWFFKDPPTQSHSSSDSFLKGFSLDLFSRPSCHNCAFRNYSSGSDLTLCDYWGGNTAFPEWDDEKGISAVLVHTGKGKRLLDSTGAELLRREVPLESVLQRNKSLISDFRPNRARLLFFWLRRHVSEQRAIRIALTFDSLLSLPCHFRPSALRSRFLKKGKK